MRWPSLFVRNPSLVRLLRLGEEDDADEEVVVESLPLVSRVGRTRGVVLLVVMLVRLYSGVGEMPQLLRRG